MGIQHKENLPASFGDSFDSGYLGSPLLVNNLVGQFCSAVESLLFAGIGEEEFVPRATGMIKRYADVFSGRNPEYKVVAGYHDQTINYRLMADLGDFWTKNRAKWNDDAVAVFFEWLLVMLAEKVRLASGDDLLLEVMFKPTFQYAVGVLLGTGDRIQS